MQNYNVLIHEVALECIENMTEEDRAYIRMHPDTSRYHFGYGMYIRNKYGPRFSDVGVYIHRDNISSDVLSEIVFCLLPEYHDISLIFDELEFTGIANQLHRYIFARNNLCAVDIFTKHY